MKLLKVLSLLVVLSLTSCGDKPSSRVSKDNVEKAERTAEEKENLPVMTFTEKEYDFGELVQGDVVETVFTFKNTGKSSLIITNAMSSCGCTIPDYPRTPIAVGEEAKIKVEFNSRGKFGKQNKAITLTTNTEKGQEQIHIYANVSEKK